MPQVSVHQLISTELNVAVFVIIIVFSLCVCLALSLSLTHTHTCMHACTLAHTHKQQQHHSVIIMPVLDLALFKVNHYLPQRFTVKIIIKIIATILLKYVFPLYYVVTVTVSDEGVFLQATFLNLICMKAEVFFTCVIYIYMYWRPC